MYDFTLSEEQRHWQQVARMFAREEIAPVVRERELIEDPSQRMPWDLIRKGSELGLRTLTLSKKHGGPDVDCLTIALVAEELATADLGVAICFDQCWKLAPFIDKVGTEDQKQRFLRAFADDHEFLLATSWTEPQSGSDSFLPYDAIDSGVKLSAVSDGDEWVLNGEKSFTSNGSVAKLYIVYARTDPTRPPSQGTSAFFVPFDTPGLRYGAVNEKIGQRLNLNAPLIFENARVPRTNLLGPENTIAALRREVLTRLTVEAAALSLGPGRAAYEASLDWATQRVQGGKPIAEHQAVALMLAEQAMRLDAARQLVWYAAWASDHQEPFDRKLTSMAKVLATETSIRVARLAMEIWAGRASMTDFPVEKFLRDAATFPHSDGTNQIMRLRVASLL